MYTNTKDYRKAKAGAEEIPALLEQVESELRYLDQLETDLELASTQTETAHFDLWVHVWPKSQAPLCQDGSLGQFGMSFSLF